MAGGGRGKEQLGRNEAKRRDREEIFVSLLYTELNNWDSSPSQGFGATIICTSCQFFPFLHSSVYQPMQ